MRGKEIKTRTVAEAIDNGIAYATEDRKTYGLNLIEDIKRNISMASLKKLEKLRPRATTTRSTRSRTSTASDLNIKAPSVLVKTGKLSGGNQQKVVLSKWIYSDPDVLILDEPTRGIDVGAKYEIYTIINRLAAAGKGIIVISSELPELLGICDRVYALSEGRITGELPDRGGHPRGHPQAHDHGKAPLTAPAETPGAPCRIDPTTSDEVQLAGGNLNPVREQVHRPAEPRARRPRQERHLHRARSRWSCCSRSSPTASCCARRTSRTWSCRTATSSCSRSAW